MATYWTQISIRIQERDDGIGVNFDVRVVRIV